MPSFSVSSACQGWLAILTSCVGATQSIAISKVPQKGRGGIRIARSLLSPLPGDTGRRFTAQRGPQRPKRCPHEMLDEPPSAEGILTGQGPGISPCRAGSTTSATSCRCRGHHHRLRADHGECQRQSRRLDTLGAAPLDRRRCLCGSGSAVRQPAQDWPASPETGTCQEHQSWIRRLRSERPRRR